MDSVRREELISNLVHDAMEVARDVGDGSKSVGDGMRAHRETVAAIMSALERVPGVVVSDGFADLIGILDRHVDAEHYSAADALEDLTKARSIAKRITSAVEPSCVVSDPSAQTYLIATEAIQELGSETPWSIIAERAIDAVWDHLTAALSSRTEEEAFQDRVRPWVVSCFGEDIAADKLERNDRFIEEALELTQACGYDRERAHALVDYVYDREPGEPSQEVGGVMVTLAAHCLAHGNNMHADGERELARISAPEIMAKIRAKQAAKPKGSALPVARSLTNGCE